VFGGLGCVAGARVVWGAREVRRWAVVGLPARCRGAAAGEPQHRVQQRSGRLWTRLKALTRSGVQGQVAASRQLRWRLVVVIRAAVWNRQ